MKFFSKQRKADAAGTISNRVAAYLERRQRKLADWLNRKTASVSGQYMLFGLIVFCSVFGGYLLYLLLNTFGVLG